MGAAVCAGGHTRAGVDSISRHDRGRSIRTCGIYARAVADDKGPIVAFLAAMDGLVDDECRVAVVVARGTRRRGRGRLAEFHRGHDGQRRRRSRRPRHHRRQPAPRERPADGVLRFARRDRRRDHHLRRHRRSAQRQLRQLRYRSGDGADQADCLDEGRCGQRRHQGLLRRSGAADGRRERRAIDEIPNVDQKLLEQFGLARSRASRQPHRTAAQSPDPDRRRAAVRHGRPERAQRRVGIGHRTSRDAAGERPG